MTYESSQRAKHPRSIVAGPYGHPFHPILVTIPIGAWTSSIVLDIASMVSDNSALAEASLWLIGIGIVGALGAAVLGLLDMSVIPAGTKARATGLTHMVLNVIALAVFAVDLWLRAGHGEDSVPTSGFVLSLVAMAIVGASGWLGGKLSYHYGVRVADEQTQADGFN